MKVFYVALASAVSAISLCGSEGRRSLCPCSIADHDACRRSREAVEGRYTV